MHLGNTTFFQSLISKVKIIEEALIFGIDSEEGGTTKRHIYFNKKTTTKAYMVKFLS